MVSNTRMEFCVGFYLSPSFIDAKGWAHRKLSSCGKGTIVIFDLPILGGEVQVMDLTSDAKEWKRVVKSLRRGKGVACVERIIERFDCVFGSMSGDVSNRPDWEPTRQKKLQVRAKSLKLAEELNFYLKYIIFMG